MGPVVSAVVQQRPGGWRKEFRLWLIAPDWDLVRRLTALGDALPVDECFADVADAPWEAQWFAVRRWRSHIVLLAIPDKLVKLAATVPLIDLSTRFESSSRPPPSQNCSPFLHNQPLRFRLIQA
jgi:hypothetical protein